MAAQDYYNPNNSFDTTPQPVPIYPRVPASQYHSPPQYQPYSQSPPQLANHPAPQYPPDFQHSYFHETHLPQGPPSSYHSQLTTARPHDQRHSYSQRPGNQYPPSQPGHSPRLEPLSPQRSYSEPPSPQEHRHHNRRHHKHHSRSSSCSSFRSRDSRQKDKRDHKSSNTFLGALGGGLIGDLILPGMGTLGGLIIGGIGGHEASRSHNHNNEKHRIFRDKYQEEYEEGKRRRHEI